MWFSKIGLQLGYWEQLTTSQTGVVGINQMWELEGYIA